MTKIEAVCIIRQFLTDCGDALTEKFRNALTVALYELEKEGEQNDKSDTK